MDFPSGSCFFHPRWCFCCHVHVFSVQVALMLLVPSSCLFHVGLAMLLLRGSFFLHPHRWFCCQGHDFSVQAFVSMFMFFPSMLSWWFDWQVHPFLLRGCFCCFYSISINAFSEGKSQMHNRVSIHVFVFVLFFIYSYYYIWMCSL